MNDLPLAAGWLPALAAVALLLVCALAIGLLARAGARAAEDRGWRDAEGRAEQLLVELLPPPDLRQLRQRGYLEVRSRQFPQRVYRIPSVQGPVGVYEGGLLTNLLCVRSLEPIPNGDVVMLHKLLLEADEATYLRVANSIRPRPFAYRI